MALPAGVDGVTVSSGSPLCLPDGTPYTGKLIFVAPDVITVPGQDTVLGGTVEVDLDDGEFEVTLAANDVTGMSPSGWTYRVIAVFDNAPGWIRHISLPKALPEVTLADVIVPDPVVGTYATLVDASAAGALTGPAGGDLTGEYPDPGVAKVGGVAITGTAAAGKVPTATSGTAASWQALPSASTSAAGVVQLDGTAGHIQALGTQAAGTTGKAADAGHVHPPDGLVTTSGDQVIDGEKTFNTAIPVLPAFDAAFANQAIRKAQLDAEIGTRQAKPGYVFDITDFGAVGDAVVVSDGATTDGVATLTCAASAPFSSGLVGKPVLIQGAGPSGVTAFATTFASYTSSSVMGLTDTPPSSITGAVVVFGTNNYDAIRAAAQAAEDYLAAGHTYAQVYSPPGGYIIDGPLDTSKAGNGQVPLGEYATTGVKKIPHIKGAGSGAGVRHWEQLVPQIAGSCWIGFGFYSSTSAQLTDLNANGNPGIISGPNEGTGNGAAYGASGLFSNIMPVIEDMAFLVPHTAYGITHGAWNFYGCANAHIRNVSVSTLGVVPGSDYSSPGVFATGLCIGALMPAPGNNDLSVIENLSFQGGFTYGLFFSEHTLITRIMALYCWAPLVMVGTYAGSVGSVHAAKILSASVEACTHELFIYGAGSSGIGPIIDIDQLSTESSTPNIAGSSSTAVNSALGRVRLTGLFTESGVSTQYPTGIELVDGQVPRAIKRKATSFTCSPLDRTLICDTSGGAITATLPDAAFNPVEYVFKNIGDDTLTAATTSSQLIYTSSGTGDTTAAVATGDSLRVQALYDGSAWGWYAV